MKGITIRLFLVIACCMLIAGPALAADVNLSVAASMKEVVTQLSDDFTRKSPGTAFQKNFGASGALAKQIENGAPCDIFISANVEWINYLKDKKLIEAGNISILAFNELVFAGRPDLNVKGMKDVLKLDKIAIGSPKSVPAGQYAMEALKKAGLDIQLEKKLVMAKDVRECLMYADRGEVDGAFVYKTDVQLAKNVKILFIVPQDLYPRVTYPVALTITGSKNDAAAAFYKFLQSDEAKKVLAKYGFTVK